MIGARLDWNLRSLEAESTVLGSLSVGVTLAVLVSSYSIVISIDFFLVICAAVDFLWDQLG